MWIWKSRENETASLGNTSQNLSPTKKSQLYRKWRKFKNNYKLRIVSCSRNLADCFSIWNGSEESVRHITGKTISPISHIVDRKKLLKLNICYLLIRNFISILRSRILFFKAQFIFCRLRFFFVVELSDCSRISVFQHDHFCRRIIYFQTACCIHQLHIFLFYKSDQFDSFLNW